MMHPDIARVVADQRQIEQQDMAAKRRFIALLRRK